MPTDRRRELFGHLLPFDDLAAMGKSYIDEEEFKRVQYAIAEILLKLIPMPAPRHNQANRLTKECATIAEKQHETDEQQADIRAMALS